MWASGAAPAVALDAAAAAAAAAVAGYNQILLKIRRRPMAFNSIFPFILFASRVLRLRRVGLSRPRRYIYCFTRRSSFLSPFYGVSIEFRRKFFTRFHWIFFLRLPSWQVAVM